MQEMLTEIYMSNAADYCPCGFPARAIEMRTTSLEEVSGYPVTIFNVNDDEIGIAEDKEEYIRRWNADPVNAEAGYLTGMAGPFLFLFIVREGPRPTFVFGNPVDDEAITTESGFDITTEDGAVLVP